MPKTKLIGLALLLMTFSSTSFSAIDIEDDSAGRGAVRWLKLDDFGEPATIPMPAQPYSIDTGELRIFLPKQTKFKNRFVQVCKAKKLDYAGRISAFFQLLYNGNRGITPVDIGKGISKVQTGHFKSGAADLQEIPDQMIVAMSNSPYIFKRKARVDNADKTPMSYVIGVAYLDNDVLEKFEADHEQFKPIGYLNTRIYQPYVAPKTYREIINTGAVNRTFISDQVKINAGEDLRVDSQTGVLNITTNSKDSIEQEGIPNFVILEKMAKALPANGAVQSGVYVACW